MGEVTAERLREIVEPAVEEAGYDLEDLEAKKAGRRILLRVVIDGDGGVGLDDIAEVSRKVGKVLEGAETTGGLFAEAPYTLEVSSPGIDRPLTLPRHWRRNEGRLATVKVGEERLEGRIVSAGERGIELETEAGVRSLEYGEMGPGKIRIEL
ncbi:ribosome maturation factor RimP [Salininema proteolyticum]|uniref:Ribosome maturation factor RimP n=1 Tax=Salininema proteolyticum TaxID=1607685 RepID=A0ABV8U224_9ACTN